MASVPFSLNRLRPLANLASYHLLFYGTLLGTELYQVLLLKMNQRFVQLTVT